MKRLANGLRYAGILFQAFLSPAQRPLVWRMIRFSRALPRQFNQPLPAMMASLTPSSAGSHSDSSLKAGAQPVDTIRSLADAVAACHFFSPLGICLRRSLLRYFFLRRAGLPVTIVFGARLKQAHEGGGLGGHAWLTLNGRPYYENRANYQGFVAMYVYPEAVES